MQGKGKSTFRVILTILTGTTGIVLFGYIFLMFQSRMTLLSLQEEMIENSSYICDAYSKYELSGKSVQIMSDRIHEAYFRMMSYAIEQDPDLVSDRASSEAFLSEMARLTGVQDIMLVDREGKVLASHAGFLQDLKDEMFVSLFQTFDRHEMVKLPIYSFSAENSKKRSDVFLSRAGYSIGIQSVQTGTDAGNQSAQSETEKTAVDNASQEFDSAWEDSGYGVSNIFPILYSMAIDDQTAFVINEYGQMQMMYEDQTDAWNYILKNEVIGSEGYAFVWSDKTGKILYYPDNTAFKGQDVSALGMNMDQIRDGAFVREKVNGQDMYLYSVYYRDQDAWVVCAVPAGELTRGMEFTGLLMWLLFGILAADFTYYAVLLLKRKKAAAREQLLPFVKQRQESSRKTKLLIFTSFCTIVIFLSSFFVQTLYLMSGWAKNSTEQINKIVNDMSKQVAQVESIRQDFINSGEILVKLAGWYIENHPEETTRQTLDTLADILMLENMSVIDEAGNVISASSSYSPDTAKTVIAGESAASGKADAAQEAAESAEASYVPGMEKFRVVTPLQGESEGISAYLNAEYIQPALDSLQKTYNLSGILETFQPGEGGIVFSVNADSGVFTWHPDSSLIGKRALDYGLKENDLQNNLCKYIQVNKKTYYAVTGQYGNDLIYLAILDEKLLRQRLPISAAAALVALVILLLTGLWLFTCPKETEEAEPETALPSGEKEKTAEQKVFRILMFGAALIAALILLGVYFRSGMTEDNVLDYVLSGNWEYGLNVFALTASLVIMLEGGLALFLFHRFMDLIIKMISVRTETVIRMLVSLVSYVIVFFIFFRCLVNFGMEPSALLTSAGIVSVIIGIGANSLVGDIIAGVFLLVEGNIQVGDMISVGEFRGIIENIGVRMTKIYDVDSEDIKIIPNKEIQNVVHMSAHLANVALEYQICYDEDLERVEKLLIEELKKPDGRIPEMIGDLTYLGVRRLDDSGVALLVKARCHEAYRPRVTRAVNRKVYMMFRRNGIEVPFPQLTVHNGDSLESEPEQDEKEGRG